MQNVYKAAVGSVNGAYCLRVNSIKLIISASEYINEWNETVSLSDFFQ